MTATYYDVLHSTLFFHYLAESVYIFTLRPCVCSFIVILFRNASFDITRHSGAFANRIVSCYTMSHVWSLVLHKYSWRSAVETAATSRLGLIYIGPPAVSFFQESDVLFWSYKSSLSWNVSPNDVVYVLPVVQHLHPLRCILLTFPLRIHWHSGKVCLDKTTHCLYNLCCVLLTICKLYMRTENNEILVFGAANNYQADSELTFVRHLCRRAHLKCYYK